ncbi:MAG: Single-stranded DNA-binding protein [Bacteriophage sp.]|nr:MAG: Single-stranded DNA-binding protein [Bacteriophage sp.]
MREQGETCCLTARQGNRKNTTNGFLRKEKIMNEIITTNTKKNEILDGINTATSSIYSSFVAESNDDKAKLYNALNSPEVRIADHIGKEINVKDVIIEPVEIVDEKTGEVRTTPRVTLIDVNGHTYTATSYGIYNSLKRIFGLYGSPTWEEGIPVRVRQITNGANRIFTLDIVTK